MDLFDAIPKADARGPPDEMGDPSTLTGPTQANVYGMACEKDTRGFMNSWISVPYFVLSERRSCPQYRNG